MSTVQLINDDYPKVPNPADNSLSSPQSRGYWREQGPSGPNSTWVIRRRVNPLDTGCRNIGHLETPGARAMQLMSVSSAGRRLGYKSRSQLYKLMNDGLLDAHVHV